MYFVVMLAYNGPRLAEGGALEALTCLQAQM